MYLMYLRKSREDKEVGLEETLDRHNKILSELADKMNIEIPKENIFKEVVSGETIEARPEMQKMLAIVESGDVDGVLVVEVERLSRGDMSDQGRILQTFYYSNTKIITPGKIYDPANDADRMFFEFGLFMSRREYEIINKRLMRGREEAAKEGKFGGSRPPYGYDKIKSPVGKGYTLKPNENAKYVQKIYDMACDGIGAVRISNYLDSIGVKSPTGGSWLSGGILRILENKTYCGYVSWQKHHTVKKLMNGSIVRTRKYNFESCDYYKGIHEAIITEEQWNKAQEMRKNHGKPRNNTVYDLKNPLAGLMFCGTCGYSMKRKTGGSNHSQIYVCSNKNCACRKGRVQHKVEEELYSALREWLKGYKVTIGDIEYHDYSDEISSCEKEIEEVRKKIDRTCSLLEEEVYTVEMFKERNSALQERLKTLSDRLKELRLSADREDELKRSQSVSVAQEILDNYDTLDIKTKNRLLKEILVKVDYFPDRLVIYPRLPKGVSSNC